MLKTEIYNKLFHYYGNIATTLLQEYQQNILESWLNNAVGESQVSQVSEVQIENCRTIALKNFKKHEAVNLVRLKHSAELNTMEAERNEESTEAIQNAENSFTLDVPLLVEETARDVKILGAISAIKADYTDNMFYHYRPHDLACYSISTRSWSPKRWGHQSSPCCTMETQPRTKWRRHHRPSAWQECIERYKKNWKAAPIVEPKVRISKHKYPVRK